MDRIKNMVIVFTLWLFLIFIFLQVRSSGQGGNGDNGNTPPSSSTSSSTTSTSSSTTSTSPLRPEGPQIPGTPTPSSTSTTTYYQGSTITTVNIVRERVNPYEEKKKAEEKRLNQILQWIQQGSKDTPLEITGVSPRQLEILMKDPQAQEILNNLADRFRKCHGQDDAEADKILKQIDKYIRTKIRKLKLSHQKSSKLAGGIPVTKSVAEKLGIPVTGSTHALPRAPEPRYIIKQEIVSIPSVNPPSTSQTPATLPTQMSVPTPTVPTQSTTTSSTTSTTNPLWQLLGGLIKSIEQARKTLKDICDNLPSDCESKIGYVPCEGVGRSLDEICCSSKGILTLNCVINNPAQALQCLNKRLKEVNECKDSAVPEKCNDDSDTGLKNLSFNDAADKCSESKDYLKISPKGTCWCVNAGNVRCTGGDYEGQWINDAKNSCEKKDGHDTGKKLVTEFQGLSGYSCKCVQQ